MTDINIIDTTSNNSLVIHNKIIIGGGAAGLMAAYSACKICLDAGGSPDVIVLEAGEEPGKKLTATGNGKCNFTNTFQEEACYRSGESDKAYRVIESFNSEKTIQLFKSIGIMNTERNGYCYPYGEQAKTLRNVLVSKVQSLGAQILVNKRVTWIEKEDGVYSVVCTDGTQYLSKKLVICAGGCAAPVFGTDGQIFSLLKHLGFKITELKPALCGLTSDYRYLKRVEGVRIKCMCYLYLSDWQDPVYKERGEIIFNKTGVSGIPILNLSRFAIKAISEGGTAKIKFDFIPDMSVKELKGYIFNVLNSSVVNVGDSLSAMINDKLLKILLSETGLKADSNSDAYDAKSLLTEAGKLAGLMKDLTINITGDNGFENAQTTMGGVLLKEINEQTMESYKYPGMYLAGEVLDVDGMCGGYNLQWAWSSGYIAGRS